MQRRPRTLALGMWLAARGGLAVTGLVLAVGGVVAVAFTAFALRGDRAGGPDALVTVASSAMAWAAGMTVAFGAAMRSTHRDQDEGIVALTAARGIGAGEYVRGRVAGLVVWLAIVAAGGTLAAHLAIAAVAGTSVPPRTMAAGLAYALAFAATLGPVAVATLGGKSHGRGYLTLVAVLVLPELFSAWTAPLLPSGWGELTSIPAALAAVRAGVASPLTDGAAFARAITGLAAVVAVSLVVIASRVQREQREAAG